MVLKRANRWVTSDIAHTSQCPLTHLRKARSLSSDPVAFGVPYHRLWRAASHQHHLSLRDTLIKYLRRQLHLHLYLTLCTFVTQGQDASNGFCPTNPRLTFLIRTLLKLV
jgi:hypothetical protein